ncbi:MAG: ABC transporter substrate-binding protein [Gammaproteobacteria bacterium]|nr:ABC transporter substrate-binding protein [Gammaproteobacteria bacterium]
MRADLRIRKSRVAVFAGLIMAAALAVAAAAAPTEAVRTTTDRILGVLKAPEGSRAQKWKDIGAIIDSRFDFRSMSQSILATNWRTATPAEKKQFVDFFSQYLEDTYRTKIEAYTNQRIEYVKESVQGDRAVVETLIVTDTAKIPVTYKLKLNDGEWFGYDVVIEGVSLINTYRDMFNAIIKAEGMDGLFSDMQRSIDDYKQKHGGLPNP